MGHRRWSCSVKVLAVVLALTLPVVAQHREKTVKLKKLKVSTETLLKAAIKKVEPITPAHVRLKGVVKVKITISMEGDVISADIVSGHLLLRAAALEAARQWKYKPVEAVGERIVMEGVLPLEFK